MGTEQSRQHPSDSELVHDAAAQSLAVHGVRMYRARTRETGDGGWTAPWSWEVGVADPAARLVKLRHFQAEDAPLEKLSEAVVRRWPWLNDGTSSPEPGPRSSAETIESGRKNYYGGPNTWIDWSDQPYHGPTYALWPLEAIIGVTTASRSGNLEARGDVCARYLCEVLPGEVAGVDGIQLVDRPQPDDDWRALSADVCIDGRGLVRWIAWSPTTAKRFRPGLLPRLATRLDKSPPPEPAFGGDGRLWNMTEFWDYGCSVEISAPTDLIDSSDTSMFDIVKDLWRMRRDYRKDHDVG